MVLSSKIQGLDYGAQLLGLAKSVYYFINLSPISPTFLLSFLFYLILPVQYLLPYDCTFWPQLLRKKTKAIFAFAVLLSTCALLCNLFALFIHFISFRFTGKAQKDWSWRIRFAAVQGLVRICRQCGGDKTKDGMCGVAWNQLMRHHSSERDVRVLEAWKLAQVCKDR